jgi:hypothetical protein
LTSLKKRLDYVIGELANMGTKPDVVACGTVAAQLSIVEHAFKESERYPVCCFTYDEHSRIVCDNL